MNEYNNKNEYQNEYYEEEHGVNEYQNEYSEEEYNVNDALKEQRNQQNTIKLSKLNNIDKVLYLTCALFLIFTVFVGGIKFIPLNLIYEV